MKSFFRIAFKMFFILTILAGCATTEEIKEADSDKQLNQGMALPEESQPDELLNQGIALLEEGQYDRAIADFDKAIEINPENASAY